MRAVFLDRDGVLNEPVLRAGRPHPPASPAELVVPPEVPAACARLKRAGLRLVCVTNQPDIARGTTTPAAVDAINQALAARLPIDEFRVCPHDDADGCGCRKPRPGLLLAAAAARGIDLAASVMVGDRWRDVAAGRAAGCHTVFIDRGYAEPRPAEADFACGNLGEAAAWILEAVGAGADGGSVTCRSATG
jgi:D-glycero-D-manno-heptose 1,7-bisphosphate phosphatase